MLRLERVAIIDPSAKVADLIGRPSSSTPRWARGVFSIFAPLSTGSGEALATGLALRRHLRGRWQTMLER